MATVDKELEGLIEAAAKAIYEGFAAVDGWDDAWPKVKQEYRKEASAALFAAGLKKVYFTLEGKRYQQWTLYTGWVPADD